MNKLKPNEFMTKAMRPAAERAAQPSQPAIEIPTVDVEPAIDADAPMASGPSAHDATLDRGAPQDAQDCDSKSKSAGEARWAAAGSPPGTLNGAKSTGHGGQKKRANETRLIDISTIDRSIQMRPVDDDLTDEYAESKAAGAILPDPLVCEVKDEERGAVIYLVDGAHRLAAYIRLGILAVQCMVMFGTLKDAMLAAAACNVTHGLRRTIADKWRAVTMALSVVYEWTDNRIAEHCGVSANFVATVREKYKLEHGITDDSGIRIDAGGRTIKPRVRKTADDNHGAKESVDEQASDAPAVPHTIEEPQESPEGTIPASETGGHETQANDRDHGEDDEVQQSEPNLAPEEQESLQVLEQLATKHSEKSQESPDDVEPSGGMGDLEGEEREGSLPADAAPQELSQVPERLVAEPAEEHQESPEHVRQVNETGDDESQVPESSHDVEGVLLQPAPDAGEPDVVPSGPTAEAERASAPQKSVAEPAAKEVASRGSVASTDDPKPIQTEANADVAEVPQELWAWALAPITRNLQSVHDKGVQRSTIVTAIDEIINTIW